MMEIVRYGYRGSVRTYRRVCGECGCIFKYTRSDVTTIFITGGGVPIEGIVCPEDFCGARFTDALNGSYLV